jgi:hypothetical protein
VPMGMLNLSDNVRVVQTVSFFGLIILLSELVIYFLLCGFGVIHVPSQEGKPGPGTFQHIPAIGSTFTQLVSVFIFSWGFVIFVPSWVSAFCRSSSRILGLFFVVCRSMKNPLRSVSIERFGVAELPRFALTVHSGMQAEYSV